MTKFRGKKSISPEIVESFFCDHLPYEIRMFRALLVEMYRKQSNQIVQNAVIESIAVHARNLIEFFKNKEACDFDPRRFTTSDYRPNGNFSRSTLESKLNQQVSHLTAERTSDVTKKFGIFLKEIVDAIENEIGRFENALTPEYRSKWRIAVKKPQGGQSA